MKEDAAAYWDSLAGEPQAAWSEGLWRRHCDAVNAALVEAWLPDQTVGRALKTDLFDEAFGEGLYPLLAGRVQSVVGVDISPAIRQAAGRRYPALVTVLADVRRLPFTDGWFDLVISTSTLDHFPSRQDILAGLRELARVLRPGGQLLLTLDNPANPAVALRNLLPWRWWNRLHLVPHSVGATCGRRRLADYARQAGLEVLETTAIMHCPRVPAVMLARRFSRRGGTSEGRRFLRLLGAFENLARWPTRFLTGYYLAMRAARPPD